MEPPRVVTVLICNSNMFVPHVLSETLRNKDNNYLVMSDIDNIIKVFTELHLANVEVLQYYQPASLLEIYSSRRRLLKQTNKYKIHKLIFFHAEFGGVINWFIGKMSKSTDICYCKVFNSIPYPEGRGIKAIKYRIAQYLLFGVDVRVLQHYPVLIPSLKQSFFRNINARPYIIDVDTKLIKEATSVLIKDVNKQARIVLLTGSTVADGYVEENEYINKTDALIEAIGSCKCVAKCHPRYNDVFSKEKELDEIPSFIPGNLIVGYYDVFISNYSTLLVEAAYAGKIAISLAYYYKQREVSHPQNIQSFFDDRLEGKGIIYYPKTISEILDIIRQSKDNESCSY